MIQEQLIMFLQIAVQKQSWRISVFHFFFCGKRQCIDRFKQYQKFRWE